jgi:hypothetical protein
VQFGRSTPNVSEGPTASILRVYEENTEAAGSSEMSIPIYKTTRRHTPDHINFNFTTEGTPNLTLHRHNVQHILLNTHEQLALAVDRWQGVFLLVMS